MTSSALPQALVSGLSSGWPTSIHTRVRPVKSRSETSGSSGLDRPAPKASVPSPPQHVLQLVRVERQRDQPDHHPLVGLARMARQRQRVVGVVAVVDVGDREVAP